MEPNELHLFKHFFSNKTSMSRESLSVDLNVVLFVSFKRYTQ